MGRDVDYLNEGNQDLKMHLPIIKLPCHTRKYIR